MARFAGRGLCWQAVLFEWPDGERHERSISWAQFPRGMGYADLGENGWPVTGALSFASLQHRTISQ
jgi:hypothetical protein